MGPQELQTAFFTGLLIGASLVAVFWYVTRRPAVSLPRPVSNLDRYCKLLRERQRLLNADDTSDRLDVVTAELTWLWDRMTPQEHADAELRRGEAWKEV